MFLAHPAEINRFIYLCISFICIPEGRSIGAMTSVQLD